MKLLSRDPSDCDSAVVTTASITSKNRLSLPSIHLQPYSSDCDTDPQPPAARLKNSFNLKHSKSLLKSGGSPKCVLRKHALSVGVGEVFEGPIFKGPIF